MKIQFYEETKLGARYNNQDYFAHIINENYACFIIADGLGGHEGGEIASKEFCLAVMGLVPTFTENLINDASNGMEQLILSAWKLMQSRVILKYESVYPQTTFALLWMDEKQLITAHVGDSRIYRLQSTRMVWRTPDHTPVQELFDKGKISEDDFGSHPLQNRLLRSVTIEESPEPDIYVHPPLMKDELLLLCTDGFWGALEQSDILLLAKSQDFKNTTQELISAILQNYPVSADNITVQIVKLI
ncbi:MAG: serine/threonine-protein phosphatase [Gammaproteobacteria bacterium]|jgi:protein phosphatase|nr:serine/threonine-protein phosphatase [Gammaproteobacteria bacterium]